MKVFILLMFVALAQTDMGSECDMAALYLELGCSPAPSSDNSTSGCPAAFTCPDLHPDPKMCFYRGVSYADKAKIPQQYIKNPCSLECVCDASIPGFSCAAVDCVENFDNDERQQCINTYDDIEACCPNGNVCGKDAINQLSTCEEDGQTYRQGQTFQPANSSKTCLCTAQWNSSDSGAFCRDLNCGVEIHHQQALMNNCAPVYSKSAKDSCPISFECPTNTTKISPRVGGDSTSSAQCLFGSQKLSIGDEVSASDQCTICSCQVPPFVTCILSTCD